MADTPSRPPACLIGQGFDGACQSPPAYAARWSDNGDGGLLCVDHAASARSLHNGNTMSLRLLAPSDSPPSTS